MPIARLLVLLLISAVAPLSHAQGMSVATWNLAWMMGYDTFQEWRSFCAAHNWNPGPGVVPAKPLPPCNVHSGLKYPPGPCLTAHGLPADAVNVPPDHACRESKTLRTWAAFAQKRDALRSAVSALKQRGVEIVFLQEVYDRTAARSLFPATDGWHVITTAELPNSVPIAQQIGVAYRGSATLVGSAKLIRSLALADGTERPVRPGLEVTFSFGGLEVDFLAVHLKAGCRSDVIDAPDSDNAVDCNRFREQIPALEEWIDAKAAASRMFAIVGDFNRTLLNDGFQPDRARLPSSDSLDPREPITTSTKIARLTPEISDGNPPGAVLNIARADYSDVAPSEICRRSVRGIDHFVLGKAFADFLGFAPGELISRVHGYGASHYAKDKALPSDHCPVSVRLERVEPPSPIPNAERGRPVVIPSPVKSAPPPPPPPAGGMGTTARTVSLLFATDRSRNAAADSSGQIDFTKAFGAERGELVYGICNVSIPPGHKIGEIERPAWWRLDFRESPLRHVAILGGSIFDREAFLTTLKQRFKTARRESALIFVHGYNVSFVDAAMRTAQIAHDVGFEGVPAFYSWPSNGSTAAYTQDAQAAQWTQANLRRFLEDFLATSEASSVFLIAHSMGSRPLTGAVTTLRPELQRRIAEVILAAPDIDADVFKRDIAPSLTKPGHPVTLYASSQDLALAASKRVHGHARAGEAGAALVLQAGIETIDASKVDTDFLGHSYFARGESVLRDLYYLLTERKRASTRSGLLEQPHPSGRRYWVFQN